jgi:hypothetical protein
MMPNGSGGADCAHCVFNNYVWDKENFNDNYCVLRKFIPEEMGYTRCANFICSEFESRPEQFPEIKEPVLVIDYGEDGYFDTPRDISELPARVKCDCCILCKGEGEQGVRVQSDKEVKLFCSMTCFHEAKRKEERPGVIIFHLESKEAQYIRCTPGEQFLNNLIEGKKSWDHTHFSPDAIFSMDIEFTEQDVGAKPAEESTKCHMRDLKELYECSDQADNSPQWLRKILWNIRHGNFWYRYSTNRFGTSGYTPKIARILINAMAHKVGAMIHEHTGIQPRVFSAVHQGVEIIVYQRLRKQIREIPVFHEYWKLEDEEIYGQSCVFELEDVLLFEEHDLIELIKSEFNLNKDAVVTIGYYSSYALVNFNFEEK